jgi:copper chaperone CopZ
MRIHNLENTFGRPLAAASIVTIAAALIVVPAGCSDSDVGASTAAKPRAAVEPVTLTFAVEGMHCGNCAASIQETIAKLDGVSACEVSFENKSVIVKASDSDASDRIIAAVRKMEYQISAKP